VGWGVGGFDLFEVVGRDCSVKGPFNGIKGLSEGMQFEIIGIKLKDRLVELIVKLIGGANE
jgi:hypothetical protein